MKTVLEYLQERREMASHNLFCYSATYAMDTPKEGFEKKFKEAVRDCEIVEELLAMAEQKETPLMQNLKGIPLPTLLKEWKRQNALSPEEVLEGLRGFSSGSSTDGYGHDTEIDEFTRMHSIYRADGKPQGDIIWKLDGNGNILFEQSVIRYD